MFIGWVFRHLHDVTAAWITIRYGARSHPAANPCTVNGEQANGLRGHLHIHIKYLHVLRVLQVVAGLACHNCTTYLRYAGLVQHTGHLLGGCSYYNPGLHVLCV